jgi:hypothetical protein
MRSAGDAASMRAWYSSGETTRVRAGVCLALGRWSGVKLMTLVRLSFRVRLRSSLIVVARVEGARVCFQPSSSLRTVVCSCSFFGAASSASRSWRVMRLALVSFGVDASTSLRAWSVLARRWLFLRLRLAGRFRASVLPGVWGSLSGGVCLRCPASRRARGCSVCRAFVVLLVVRGIWTPFWTPGSMARLAGWGWGLYAADAAGLPAFLVWWCGVLLLLGWVLTY